MGQEMTSLSPSELEDLLASWADMNFTDELNNMSSVNISNVDATVCVTTFNRSFLLYFMCIVYLFIFIIGLAANALVLWVNVRSQRDSVPRHETHTYIAHLAMADLCVCVTLPVWVSSLAQHGHWPFGEVACKLTHLMFSVNLFSSIFFLACMSVDRYISVRRRGDGEGGRRAKLIRWGVCVGVWLLALVASLPDTYFLRAVKSAYGDTMVCRPVYPEDTPLEWMVGVQLSFILLGFALPFPVIAVFYALLARELNKSSSSSSSSDCSAVDRERRVSCRVILAYIVVFLGCWGPYHGVLLVEALVELGLVSLSCGLQNVLYVALHLTQCLSLVHCCFNPILYNFINRNYRYDLMKAFIFKYSTRTGLARLIEASHASDPEYSAVALDNPPQI